jgi:hypothetical protein
MKFLVAIIFCLLAGISVLCRFSGADNLSFDAGGLSQSFPGPDLFYPITDDIDLKGKPSRPIPGFYAR